MRQAEDTLHQLMIAPGGCSKIDKYWQVDILLDDSMSLDASLFLPFSELRPAPLRISENSVIVVESMMNILVAVSCFVRLSDKTEAYFPEKHAIDASKEG